MAKYLTTASVAVIAAAMLGGPAQAQTTEGPLGEGMVIYMQMGGNAGDGATLARTTGARDAAKAFGVKLIEQYSAWQPEIMLNQFREAAAASPACIGIMGHPGSDAFADLVDEARGQGIVVTSGNAPLTALFDQYQAGGFGYAGVELYAGGYLTGKSMVEAGINAGDKALVYGLLSEAERGQSTKGLIDALTEAGAVVDYLEISPGPLPVCADPHRLFGQQPRCQGHGHTAWRRHVIYGQSASGRRQGTRRSHCRRH